jgi:hypothetical protein
MKGLSMATRREIGKSEAKQYQKASKNKKTEILDEVTAVTGWGRKHAIKVLNGKIKTTNRKKSAKTRGCEYLPATTKALEKVWIATNFMNSKSLKIMIPEYVSNMRKNGHLVGFDGCWEVIEPQLLKMSASTIDNKLKPIKNRMKLKGKSLTHNTKEGTRLRDSFKIRRVGDEVPKRPGFIENDTVSHCGGDAKGEFARTLTSTDIYSGWTENVAVRNNAHANIRGAFDTVRDRLPFAIEGMDYDNGSEFINHNMLQWHEENGIGITTRSRPYKKNDNAHVEQKNNDIVRKFAFYYRYDTLAELDLLNELYELVRIKFNIFTPTRKAVKYVEAGSGRRTRIYDKPKTPFDRLKDAGVLSNKVLLELEEIKATTDLFGLQLRIQSIQRKLINCASKKNGFNELSMLAAAA